MIEIKDISLFILDIVQNSIRAESKNIEIIINENKKENTLLISIIDDGKGMDEKALKKVEDPFYTTRTTRKVGLGIPLLKLSAEMTQGKFEIKSQKGVGTKIFVEYQYEHIDRPPLGDVTETIITLIMLNSDVDFLYKYIYNRKEFLLCTKEVKKILDGANINDFKIIDWIKDYINEGVNNIKCENYN